MLYRHHSRKIRVSSQPDLLMVEFSNEGDDSNNISPWENDIFAWSFKWLSAMRKRQIIFIVWLLWLWWASMKCFFMVNNIPNLFNGLYWINRWFQSVSTILGFTKRKLGKLLKDLSILFSADFLRFWGCFNPPASWCLCSCTRRTCLHWWAQEAPWTLHLDPSQWSVHPSWLVYIRDYTT